MTLKIIETDDGSHSFYNEELDETYHSRHGAIREAKHVFLKKGLEAILKQNSQVDLLEIGFGTGLNAWLTSIEILGKDVKINYSGVEAFPLNEEQIGLLNYTLLSDEQEEKDLFHRIHNSKWEEKVKIHDGFFLKKRKLDFKDIDDKEKYDLIYFDAFGPRVQPELWSVEIFAKMYTALRSNGVLVTYSAKGDVRRAMIKVGFKVERVDGPPGKREMLVAKKV